MNGITGVVNTDGVAVNRSSFDLMADEIRSQGNGLCEGIHLTGASLAAAVLPVPGDRFTGSQPFCLDDEYWIIADARLDDREAAVIRLWMAGENPRARASDAEIILRSYRAWGRDCVKRLAGDFAFAIWDAGQRSLFCARDHFGCKPFYYSEKSRRFLFSNTLRSLRRHPAVSDRLNEQAIGDFLLFDINRDLESTCFADVRRLAPGHSLTWSGGRLEMRRYWELPIEDELRYRRQSDYIEHFRELLGLAVKDRLRARRVGVLMSGGMDSTAVAATATEIGRRDRPSTHVRAFCTAYDGVLPCDERYYAGITARRIGIPISFLPAEGYGLFDTPAQPGYQPAEPQNTPHYALWMDQFRQAARYSPVALHGNGGDDLLDQREGQIYAMLRRGKGVTAGVEFVRSLLTHGYLPRIGLWDRLRARLGREEDWSAQYPEWLNPVFEKRLDLRSRWHEVEESDGPQHPRHTWAFQLLQDPIWPASFESFHPGATGCNLDVRHPLLDLRLARFCLSLPQTPWMEDKGLLRAAMRGRLPGPVRRRPKTPLPISPEEVCLRNGARPEAALHPELRVFVNQRVLEERIDSDSVDALMDLRPLALSKYLGEMADPTPDVKSGDRRAA